MGGRSGYRNHPWSPGIGRRLTTAKLPKFQGRVVIWDGVDKRHTIPIVFLYICDRKGAVIAPIWHWELILLPSQHSILSITKDILMNNNPITIKQWKLIRYALSYAYSNWDDVQEAFDEEDLGPAAAVADLLERAKIEANEARKLALCYFDLYPKEAPAANHSQEMWESIDCTFQSWLNRLYEEPEKALAKANWAGKVTKAYCKMIGLSPSQHTPKWEIVEMVKNHLMEE